MNPAGMGAPALRTGNGSNLLLHSRGMQGGVEVVIVIGQSAQLGAQFAGAKGPIVIDNDSSQAGGAAHRPAVFAVVIPLVDVKVQLDISEIPGAGQRARRLRQMTEQFLRISLMKPEQTAV